MLILFIFNNNKIIMCVSINLILGCYVEYQNSFQTKNSNYISKRMTIYIMISLPPQELLKVGHCGALNVMIATVPTTNITKDHNSDVYN